MPFANSNDYITGRKQAKFPAGSEVVCERFTIALGTADLALNTIGQVGVLPAGCVPLRVVPDWTDMDSSTAALVMQFGIWDGASANISTAAADGGAAWGSTTASNTAGAQDLGGVAIPAVQPATTDRRIGMKVTTAPTTPVAGTLGLTVWYHMP